MGLGLYIVRTIIKLHGGEITVQSVENEYCQFEFWIPKHEEPKLKAGKRKRILQRTKGGEIISDTDWNRESGMVLSLPRQEVPVPSPTSEEPAMKTKEFSGKRPAAITAQQSGEDIAQTPRETTSSDLLPDSGAPADEKGMVEEPVSTRPFRNVFLKT